MSHERWEAAKRTALWVIERSGIDYSPNTSCFTPGAPYPRSTTPPGATPAVPDLSAMVTSIYVHIPYCSRKCSFCPFFARAGCAVPDAYVDGIVRHLELVDRTCALPATFELRLGGGSPNLLSPVQLGRIVGHFAPSRLELVNIEVHPECSAVPGYVASLVELGVTNLSVGLQSSAGDVLRATGRGHDPDALAQLAAQVAVTPIALNVDIMYGGLREETAANAALTFRFAFEELRPATVNAYRVGYQRGVPEHERFIEHPERYPSTVEVFEITALLEDTAAASGYSYLGMGYYGREPAPKPALPRLATVGIGAGSYTHVVDLVAGTGLVAFAPFDTERYLQLLARGDLPVERAKHFDRDYLDRWAALLDFKARRPMRHAHFEAGPGARLVDGLAALGLIEGRSDGSVMTDAGILLEDLLAALLMPRTLWQELSRRRRQSAYTPTESRYDWFFDPDVVLAFLDFVASAPSV
jgi:coproporphyrinogen III oxidase-like Fe-S oxidoreductase